MIRKTFFLNNHTQNVVEKLVPYLLPYFKWDLLLLFCCLSHQEKLYMIHLLQKFFYDIWITAFHWCFQPNLISGKKWLKKLFYNFIYSIINHDLSPFECSTPSSSLSLVDTKLIPIVDWIFHVSDFLKSFMIPLSML